MAKETRKVIIGEVGVDSGQIMVCDPCYIESSWKKNSQKKSEAKKIDFAEAVKQSAGQFSYLGACNATLHNDNGGGELGSSLGVAVSSGFGDGCYPVIATLVDEGAWGWRVKSITVKFF